jgi:hypothetical protein
MRTASQRLDIHRYRWHLNGTDDYKIRQCGVQRVNQPKISSGTAFANDETLRHSPVHVIDAFAAGAEEAALGAECAHNRQTLHSVSSVMVIILM